MGLGGVGVRLTELTALYAGIARADHGAALERPRRARAATSARLLDPVAAWYVGECAHRHAAARQSPAGRIAFKTGTSYGYRDAWSVGFDGKATIGVWVGRPDGAPVPGLVGRTAAAPILFDAFARSGGHWRLLCRRPEGAIFATTARLPPTLHASGPAGCRAGCAARFAHPVSPGRHAARAAASRPKPMALKIQGGVEPLTHAGERRPARRGSAVAAPCSSIPTVRASCA